MEKEHLKQYKRTLNFMLYNADRELYILERLNKKNTIIFKEKEFEKKELEKRLNYAVKKGLPSGYFYLNNPPRRGKFNKRDL